MQSITAGTFLLAQAATETRVGYGAMGMLMLFIAVSVWIPGLDFLGCGHSMAAVCGGLMAVWRILCS